MSDTPIRDAEMTILSGHCAEIRKQVEAFEQQMHSNRYIRDLYSRRADQLSRLLATLSEAIREGFYEE